MSKDLLIHLCLILILLAGQTNCFISAQNKKIKFGETFTLQPDELAETEDAKLQIRLKGVGRTISQGGETEYVELQVRWENSERSITISEGKNKAVSVGGYVIKLIDAESFGKTHCQLKVSRKN